MKNEIRQFEVSCSGWSVNVDSDDFESAAICGLIMAIKNFNSDLLLSTTIMVSESKVSKDFSINNAEFFSTESILNKIGLNNLSEGLSIISELKLEKELSLEYS
tara:strand:+ start:542 stop:853 length:312 start_codon:yes stop_codon:yes gene_type:complete